MEPAVNMGPLRTRKAQLKARGLLDDAIRRGAHVVNLGAIDDETIFSGGVFHGRPVAVTGIADEAPLMTLKSSFARRYPFLL